MSLQGTKILHNYYAVETHPVSFITKYNKREECVSILNLI